MPFIRKDHPVLNPPDTTSDAHAQDHLNMMGGEYLSDPGLRTKLNNMGHEGAWTAEDGIYALSHSGKGGRSLQAIISKHITDTGLRQAGQAPPPADTTPPPPSEPSPDPAPVGRSGEYDDLEIAVAELGLGKGTTQEVDAKIEAVERAVSAAIKKLRAKLATGQVWEVAVNLPRLGRIFGNQGRFVSDELSQSPLQKRAYEAALGLPFSEEGSSDGLGIGGNQGS